MWFHDEIWYCIKSYLFDYFAWWKHKIRPCISFINCLKPKVKRLALTPLIGKNEYIWSVESVHASYGMPVEGRILIYQIQYKSYD